VWLHHFSAPEETLSKSNLASLAVSVQSGAFTSKVQESAPHHVDV
jgi:hypothetical protein